MSRRTTLEFVDSQRRAYAQLKTKDRKSAFIDALCLSCGFERLRESFSDGKPHIKELEP